MALKIILTAALGLLFVSTNFAQQQKENYSAVFSSDYQRAIEFLQTEKGIDSIIRSHGLNPKEVTAIVFPELIRYNSIQDKLKHSPWKRFMFNTEKNTPIFRLANFKSNLLC